MIGAKVLQGLLRPTERRSHDRILVWRQSNAHPLLTDRRVAWEGEIGSLQTERLLLALDKHADPACDRIGSLDHGAFLLVERGARVNRVDTHGVADRYSLPIRNPAGITVGTDGLR